MTTAQLIQALQMEATAGSVSVHASRSIVSPGVQSQYGSTSHTRNGNT